MDVASQSQLQQNSYEAAVTLARQALKELSEVVDQLNRLDEAFDVSLLNQGDTISNCCLL
jgi:hypothetical protein